MSILDAVSSVMSLRLLSAEDDQVLLMLCGHIETQPRTSPTKSPGVAPLCPTEDGPSSTLGFQINSQNLLVFFLSICAMHGGARLIISVFRRQRHKFWTSQGYLARACHDLCLILSLWSQNVIIVKLKTAVKNR